MTQSFDLIREAWIPCIDRNGSPVRLGLRDVFAHAHELRAIAHRSPFVTIALHRLLLAIAHRVFGPETDAVWAALAREGRWDTAKIDAYFDRWQDRFDLFHPTRPFYQVAVNLPESKQRSIRCMVHELPQGNNSVLWDPHRDEDPALTPAEAACYLVAAQSFTDGGRKPAVEKGGTDPSRASHLSRGITVLMEGDTLFRTLLLNMVRYDPARGVPGESSKEDCPAWESERTVGNQPRRPTGYLDLLTWQPRRIQLYPVERDGKLVVERVLLATGEELPVDIDMAHIETMMPFVVDSQKEKKGLRVHRPERPDPVRALWRDSLSLFRALTPQKVPAQTVEIAARRLDEGFIEPKDRYRLAVFGPIWGDANYARLVGWVDERLPLPAIYLATEGQTKRELISEALQHAENGATVLFWTADAMALALECPGKNAAALSGAEKSRVTRRRNALLDVASVAYWAVLGSRFPALVEAIAAADSTAAEAMLVEWSRMIRSQVLQQSEAIIGRIAPSGRKNLRAIADAERALARGLKHYHFTKVLNQEM